MLIRLQQSFTQREGTPQVSLSFRPAGSRSIQRAGQIQRDVAAEVVHSASDPDMPGTGPPSVDALLLEEYRRLTREHLEGLPALFTRLTGLESCVAWAPTWPHRWSEHDLSTDSAVCRQITAGNPSALARCQECGRRHLVLALKAGPEGHHFLCRHGVRNFWFPIIVRRGAVGIAFVQALDCTGVRGLARQKAIHSSPPAPLRSGQAPRPHRAVPKPMTPSEFKQVARLLQLICQHAQTSVLADLRKKDLTQAQQALLELQKVATRLREELNGLVPAFNKAAPMLQPENHAARVVRAAMDYVQHHYTQPMTLQGCANALRLSAAYLSALFGRTVGLPFKKYLTDVRLEEARRLLNDPTRHIAEVASAVGYASENRFRDAFKKATGLSPRGWRETFRAALLFLLGWLLREPEYLESVEAFCLV